MMVAASPARRRADPRRKTGLRLCRNRAMHPMLRSAAATFVGRRFRMYGPGERRPGGFLG
jgi:hypothetical protein